MKRPKGVTILALLNIVTAVFTLVVGVLFGLGVALAGVGLGLVAQRSHENPFGQGVAGGGIVLGMFAVVLAIVFALVSIVVGIGLWRLWNWTRILTIVVSGMTALFCAFTLLLELLTLQVWAAFFSLTFLAVSVFVIWYLLRPHVKRAFKTPGALPAAQAGLPSAAGP